MKNIIKFLISSGIEYEENVSGKKLTSFGVGGNVRLVVRPRDYEQIIAVFKHLERENIPHMLIGRGSNIVIDDEGFDGVMVLLSEWNRIVVEGEHIAAGGGASLMSLAVEARKHSLTGLEFAHGIPGSVGGGVYMNAGAYGGEISDVLTSCECYDKKNGRIICLESKDCDLSYRHSIFQDNKDLIVLGAFFKLKQGNEDEIHAKMDSFRASRLEKQPLEYRSAGSTFKRPENSFAGKLIEDAGLKGVSVGGAQVSEKHAGFIINKGNATSEDIRDLVELVKKRVRESSGIMLECEIEFISNEETFSDRIKREFTSEEPHKTCCRRALVYGLLFDAFTEGDKIHIDVRKPEVADHYVALLSKQISKDVQVERIKKLGKRYFRISLSSEAVSQRISGLDDDGAKFLDYISIKCDRCRINFLRGVFLARGSFTLSSGNDHLEFRIQHEKRAELLHDFLVLCKTEPRMVVRKNAVGIYYKNAERLEDILNLLEAQNAFFEIVNKRIEREIIVQETRAVNCEAVNIKKQVETARKHLHAIEVLDAAGLLDKLEGELRESVRLRLENPISPLSELAAMHEPPITKSVLNNRFNKLIRMADKLAENKK